MFITDNEEKKRKWPELWRDIPGYEGIYQVSNHGRVKSLERVASNGRLVQERILKAWDNKRGYLNVRLYKNGESKKPQVHRLVAEAFEINRRAGQDQVDHIDGDKKNNCVWNLRYATRRENLANPNALGGGLARCIPVESFDLATGETIKRYTSAMEAERRDGYKNSNIGKCIKHIHKKHGGVGWRRQQQK